MPYQLTAFNIANAVHANVKPALSRHRRVKISQRTCRSVARIFKLFFSAFVKLIKHAQPHIAFALAFHLALKWYCKRYSPYCHCLGQYGLPRNAVAARCGLNKLSAVVCKVYGKPVELIFKRIAKLRQRRIRMSLIIFIPQPFRTSAPFYKLALRAHLIHAPKPAKVPMLAEFAQWFETDPPCGRIVKHYTRLLFKAEQFIKQLIVFLIAHLRRGGIIICLGIFIQQRNKLPHTFIHRVISLPFIRPLWGKAGHRPRQSASFRLCQNPP